MRQQTSVIFRQGDVLVQRVATLPRVGRDLAEQGRVILAHGEVTGHAHQVVPENTTDLATPPAAFFEQPDGTRVLFVDRPCSLVHQEHAPIQLLPGVYRVVRQREYVAEDLNRSVAD